MTLIEKIIVGVKIHPSAEVGNPTRTRQPSPRLSASQWCEGLYFGINGARCTSDRRDRRDRASRTSVSDEQSYFFNHCLRWIFWRRCINWTQQTSNKRFEGMQQVICNVSVGRVCLRTKLLLVLLLSSSGMGKYTARATQLAKMARRIMISKGLRVIDRKTANAVVFPTTVTIIHKQCQRTFAHGPFFHFIL